MSVNFPEPDLADRPADFTVRYAFGKGWYVITPAGERLDGYHKLRSSAAGVAGWAKRKQQVAEKTKDRPCMSCRETFRSEGPHNRLCNQCRHRSAGPITMTFVNPRSRTGR